MKITSPRKIEINFPLSELQESSSNHIKKDKNNFRRSRNITNNFSLYQNNVINNYLLTEAKTSDNFSSKIFSASSKEKLKTINNNNNFNNNIINKNFTKQKSIIKLVKKNTINIENNNNSNNFPLINTNKTFKKQNTVTFLDNFKFKNSNISSNSLEKIKLMNQRMSLKNNYRKKSSLKISPNNHSFKHHLSIKENLSKSLFNLNKDKNKNNLSLSIYSKRSNNERITIDSYNSDNSNNNNINNNNILSNIEKLSKSLQEKKLEKNLEEKNLEEKNSEEKNSEEKNSEEKKIHHKIKKKKTYQDLFYHIFENEKVISKKFITDLQYKFDIIDSNVLDKKLIFIDNMIESINNNRLIFNDREKLYKDMERRLFYKFSFDKLKDHIFIKKQTNYIYFVLKKNKREKIKKFSIYLYSFNNYIDEKYLNVNVYKNIYEDNIINIHKKYKIFKKSSKSFLSTYSNKSLHFQKSMKIIHHSKLKYITNMIINKKYNFNYIKNLYSIEYMNILIGLEKTKDIYKNDNFIQNNNFNKKTFVRKRTNKFLKIPSSRSIHEHGTLRSYKSFRSMKSFYENDTLSSNVKQLIYKSLKNNEFYKRNKIYHIVHHKEKSTPIIFNFHLKNKLNENDFLDEGDDKNQSNNNDIKFQMTQNNMVYKVNEYKNYLLNSLKAVERAIFYIKDRNFPFFKKIFEEKNLSPDIKDENGNPLLILAVQSNSFQTVNYLLNKGANPNVQNLNLNTPLHYALTFHNFEIADMLIQTGANEKIKNKMGNTPWECLNTGASIV